MESYLDRKERLRNEGKIELPLNIDTKKYLIGSIAYYDLLIVSPFAIVTIILLIIFYQTGSLSEGTFILSLSPTAFITMLQLIKHPVRKNLSFLNFRVVWKIKYKLREKQFQYQKGDIDMENQEDVRQKLGIKNVYSDAYETTDGHFVKVIEVSSVNLSLMNDTEMKWIFDGMKSFLNEINKKHLQIEELAQPVNLSQYLLYVDHQTENESDYAKRMLIKSYKQYVENIQKSRNMVQRKRYVILRSPIGSDREKALKELQRDTTIMESKIENMLSGSSKLDAKTLQNDDLIKLIYTCLDYDNSQAQGDYIVDRANNQMPITMGEQSAREVIDAFERKMNETIN